MKQRKPKHYLYRLINKIKCIQQIGLGVLDFAEELFNQITITHCPNDGAKLVIYLTVDEGNGDTLYPCASYRCPQCSFELHDYEDGFEYPDNYDELLKELCERWDIRSY